MLWKVVRYVREINVVFVRIADNTVLSQSCSEDVESWHSHQCWDELVLCWINCMVPQHNQAGSANTNPELDLGFSQRTTAGDENGKEGLCCAYSEHRNPGKVTHTTVNRPRQHHHHKVSDDMTKRNYAGTFFTRS